MSDEGYRYPEFDPGSDQDEHDYTPEAVVREKEIAGLKEEREAAKREAEELRREKERAEIEEEIKQKVHKKPSKEEEATLEELYEQSEKHEKTKQTKIPDLEWGDSGGHFSQSYLRGRAEKYSKQNDENQFEKKHPAYSSVLTNFKGWRESISEKPAVKAATGAVGVVREKVAKPIGEKAGDVYDDLHDSYRINKGATADQIKKVYAAQRDYEIAKENGDTQGMREAKIAEKEAKNKIREAKREREKKLDAEEIARKQELAKLDKMRGGVKKPSMPKEPRVPKSLQPRSQGSRVANLSLRGRGSPVNVNLGGTAAGFMDAPAAKVGMPNIAVPNYQNSLSAITPQNAVNYVHAKREFKHQQEENQKQINQARQRREDEAMNTTFMAKGNQKRFVSQKGVLPVANFGLIMNPRAHIPTIAKPRVGISLVKPRIGTGVGTSSRKTHNEFLAISKPRNVVSTSGKINQNKSASPAAHISRNIAGMIAPTRAHTSGHTRVSTGITNIVNNTNLTGHTHHSGRKFNMDVKLPSIAMPGLKKKKKNEKSR